jgi:hypothetical protein
MREYGSIPAGAHLHHICETKGCRNLDHIILCEDAYEHLVQFHSKAGSRRSSNDRGQRLIDLYESNRTECS